MITSLKNWIDNYCNTRIHGTIKEKPISLFTEKEKPSLIVLPSDHFTIGLVVLRKVHSDCHVTIDNNYYSVPHLYVSKTVEIELTDNLVKIYSNNEMIALHTRIKGKGQFATISSHYPKYKDFAHDSELYLAKSEEDMAKIGENTKSLFSIIVKENKYSWYRIVRGILSLRKIYTDQIIELACKRALYFEITGYRKIKSICDSGSYNLDLPNY